MMDANINEFHRQLIGESDFSSFRPNIAGNDVIAVLGSTRSGKSTLINYLIGTRLMAIEQRPRRTLKIVKSNENDEGPRIGVGVVSCTRTPKRYSYEQSLLIDFPGFDDNRSEIQDIINSIYISHVKYAARVKFVLVYDLNLLLGDNVNQCIDFLHQIQTLFENFEHLKNSVVMVFSKDFQDFSVEEVVDILTLQLLSDNNLQARLELVRHLVDTIARIAIFKAPKSVGEVTNVIDWNIKEAISECPWANLNPADIKISVSLRSREFLQTIYNNYLSREFFYDQIKGAVDHFQDLEHTNNYIFASTDGELRGFLNDINPILGECELQIFSNHANFCDIEIAIRIILSSNINVDFSKVLEVLTALDNSSLMDINVQRNFIGYYNQSLTTAISKFTLVIERIISEQNIRTNDRLYALSSVVSISTGLPLAFIRVPVSTGLPLAFVGVPLCAMIMLSIVSANFALMMQNRRRRINERILARHEQERWVIENMFD